MSKNIHAFISIIKLLYDIAWRATRTSTGYCADGVITFVIPFVNTLIIGSWFIRLSTKQIHNNRFYVRLEIVNLDSDAAAVIAQTRT